MIQIDIDKWIEIFMYVFIKYNDHRISPRLTVLEVVSRISAYVCTVTSAPL